MRRVGLAAVVALLLAGQAQAAETSAPDRLPSEVQGVVGSGDQLSLKLKDSAGGRTIKIGEVYGDGWTLTGLTPAKATLAKDGATREVGLNLTGAVAGAGSSAAPTIVTMTGIPDEATIVRLLADRAARTGPRTSLYPGLGLTEAEARRMDAYAEIVQVNTERANAFRQDHMDEIRAGKVKSPIVNQREVLGEAAYADLWVLQNKSNDAYIAAEMADLAVNPHTGPDRVPMPTGMDLLGAIKAAGLDTRGEWHREPNSQGGQVLVWYPPVPVQRQALPPPLVSTPGPPP